MALLESELVVHKGYYCLLRHNNRCGEKWALKQSHGMAYVVDLTKIEGAGDFPCPRCGVVISPEDDSENVYSILETKVRDECLEELVVLCHKCRSKIRLTGFLSSVPEEK